MSFCQVVNDNVHPFVQEFKEQMIRIPAGGHVEMDQDDAVQFMGMFYPPKKDGNDQPDPRFFKKLRIVPVKGGQSAPAQETFVCQKCKHVANSKEDLSAHIDENHLDDLADADFKEEHIAEIAKRGRGRPPGAKNKE